MADTRDDQPEDTALQRSLVKTRIAPDLLTKMAAPAGEDRAQIQAGTFAVVIEMNAAFPGGCRAARAVLLRRYLTDLRASDFEIPEAALARRAIAGHATRASPNSERIFDDADRLAIANTLFTDNFVFGEVTRETINRLGGLTCRIAKASVAPIHKIWLDHQVQRMVFESTRTVKCDAARAAFGAAGKGIVWAVADTGVDESHPHFHPHATLTPGDGLMHRDFTGTYASDAVSSERALVDTDGHGTHVAGIIAGESVSSTKAIRVRRAIRTSDVDGTVQHIEEDHKGTISGLAPLCKILSLKVLQKGNGGQMSYLLAAMGYLQSVNENGRHLKVHGLNLSLGYPFRPDWFAAGQSPLSVEVDRLVRSGVVVVIAAGNGGYGTVNTNQGTAEAAAHGSTIADPGNADLAITVGSTHRDMPHTYGVSYFSAKGPTADGRMKPDIVAPGERIVSCALMDQGAKEAGTAPFKEDSGTSMAAPHVSGAAAAFLSVRGEFKGKPERLKGILVASAIDLKRRAEFQGAGLVDVMAALQSV